MIYLRTLRRRLAALIRLVLPLGVLTLAGAPGCSLVTDVRDAVTRDESAADKASRLVLVAYDTHAAVTDSVRAAVVSGACSKEKGASLHGQLVDAKSYLDRARMLIALGDATRGMESLARAETVMRLVIAALEAK